MHAPVVLLAIQLHHHIRGPKVDYVSIVLACAVSWAAISGPGEAALIAAGVEASHGGRLDIASVLVAGWVGAMAGGVAGWAVGRAGGTRVVLAGGWLRGWRERALEAGNRFFERFGWLAVYFAPSWVAGVNGMSAVRFLPANAVSAAVWALLIGLGSYALGPSIRDIAGDIGLIGTVALVVLGLAAAAGARIGLRRRRR